MAGDSVEIASSGFDVTYTGLVIKGGSGTDYIYNGATDGVIVDGNGKGDISGLGGSSASATLGSGANDVAYVGGDPIGGTFSGTAGNFEITGATSLAAGASLNDTVTFGAGATATVILVGGAEAGTSIGSPAGSVGLTNVIGAADGTVFDFSKIGLSGSSTVVDETAAVTTAAAQNIVAAANAAVNALDHVGVAYFSFANQEYLVTSAAASPTAGLVAADAVVHLAGVSLHDATMSGGVLHFTA